MAFGWDVKPAIEPTLCPIERLRLDRELWALAKGYKRVCDLDEVA